MRSRRPEPRNNQFAPRVQQRYPPQMRGQMAPQQPPMGHPPVVQGRSQMANQGAAHHIDQRRAGQVRPPQQLTREFLGGSARPTPPMMGGQGRSTQPFIGRQLPQMLSQPPMGPPLGPQLQDVSGVMPAAQHQIIQGPAIHVPQQIMPTRVINQEVQMPTVIHAPAPPPCSTDVIVPQTQYEEILPAQKVVYEQVLMPMPNSITAPAPPPCPMGTLVEDVIAAPQTGRFPQQPMNGRVHPHNQQLRFKE